MIIKETIEEIIKTEKLKDVLCNKCSKSIILQYEFYAGCMGTFSFNYGSVYDGDLDTFHLCDKCYEEFVNTLQIKPDKKQEGPWFLK